NRSGPANDLHIIGFREVNQWQPISRKRKRKRSAGSCTSSSMGELESSSGQRVRNGRRAGSILAGRTVAGVPFGPRGQNPLASWGRTGRGSVAPRDVNGPGAGQGTQAIRS